MKVKYRCECGKEFDNPQSFNGHKGHCLVHLGKDRYENNKLNRRNNGLLGGEIAHQKFLDKEKEWVDEKHTCEKCGKVMTQKFGSGRFCSRVCANSREFTPESRIKKSETLRGRKLTDAEKEKLFRPRVKRVKYNGPELPNIDKETLDPGYFTRDRSSYAEKFWKKVLDNNNIKYEAEAVVQKPHKDLGVYRLDFKIGNVDLEIDGSLHSREDVKEKDDKRDQYLKSLGYIVYRIPWINPNSEPNKILVNKQIEDFLNFINQI